MGSGQLLCVVTAESAVTVKASQCSSHLCVMNAVLASDIASLLARIGPGQYNIVVVVIVLLRTGQSRLCCGHTTEIMVQ